MPANAFAYALRNCIGDESRRWKNVTLKIMGSEEELTLPLMQASTVWDVKCMLGDALNEDPGRIELFDKVGCKFKKQRNSEEIATKVLVKGIKNFARRLAEYPHPFVVIGGGHLGLRQSVHWTRTGFDFLLFERKTKLGGNAWNGIANKWSKLQSEGPHYHMNWDSFDGGRDVMMPFNKYSYWPTRDEILSHFHDVMSCFNIWPYMRMSTQIVDMAIAPPPHGKGEEFKTYWLKHVGVGDQFQKSNNDVVTALDTQTAGEEGWAPCSCICFYPGALAAPHRKTFPGEDVFGGQIGYGFNDEFDYASVHQQQGIVIGMGAFAVENVRTLMEHAAKKFFVIARHHNLLLPRMLSWWVNQTRFPPPAAAVLKAMEPIYKLYGTDPWSYFSVTATADRKHASIKQYTRWGIGDIYFLAVYFGKVETVEGEVKRMKYRTAVINNGRVLTDLDHMIKVLGFDGDFGVDRIMKTKVHIGFWPDGDYRRWVTSDQSAIDASRFGGTAIAPYGAAITWWGTHFFKYPQDAGRMLATGLLAENRAKPELGSPAYHYEPRTAAGVQVAYGGILPDMAEFDNHNSGFKKESMWVCAPMERFHEECEKDWIRYCEKFKEFGETKEPPAYPYDIAACYELLYVEDVDSTQNSVKQGTCSREDGDRYLEARRAIFDQKIAEHTYRRENGLPNPPAYAETSMLEEDRDQELARETLGQKDEHAAEQGQQLLPFEETNRSTIKERSQMVLSQLSGGPPPGSEETFHPARHVLNMRSRSPEFGRSSSPTMRKLNQEWLSGAHAVREAILQASKSR